jgi:gluconolactonase
MTPRVGYLMRVFAVLAAVALVSGTANAQGRSGRGQGQTPPPKDVVAPAIPGVVAVGTRIELVAFPVQGTEGPIGLPDGSGIIFTERRADPITKVDASANTSIFVEKPNGSNGLGWDSRGRLISVQRARGNEKVGRAVSARQRCHAGGQLRGQAV